MPILFILYDINLYYLIYFGEGRGGEGEFVLLLRLSQQQSIPRDQIFIRKIYYHQGLKTRGSAHWACIAHLTIEWYWSKFQREIIITLKNSSHLEWRVGLSDTILKGTHPGTIYAKFGSIWPSCFRGEDFFNINQSEKRIILGSHVYRPNGTKWRNFIEDLT